ncbi:LysR family transcriptional regulator [Mangrovitalea sediminis]|uniref:LysR family transcriptional regulator n=1 Tax=Mangrovitalea sediminis TaxID=1982043 RepID=UPI000BE5FF5A|nr:LysR family transcriptional regulator [Mangrovitalea sediminis]
MNRLEDMRIFVESVDAGSFTAAAERLELSKQFVSKRVSALEAGLGARLLIRTTRKLRVTELGLAYYERARGILQQVDDAEQMVASQVAEPRGLLRVAAPMSFGTMHLSPAIPDFLQRYPEVSLDLDLNDRRVDLISEGYDMALRIGKLEDSSMIARRLAPLDRVICASPAYLERHGEPASPEALRSHTCLLYGLNRSMEWDLVRDGKALSVPVSGRLRVNNGELLRDAAIAGLGLAFLPTFIIAPALSDGRLVSLLDAFRPPATSIYAVYPQHRQSSLLIRSLTDFLHDRFNLDVV